MSEQHDLGVAADRPWDARLARRLVAPLEDSWVTPNHLTTLRLAVGMAAAAAFLPGTYGWANAAALLVVLSNFLDHADGELARISGKSSRFGHWYDLASDAAVTIALFVAMGIGIDDRPEPPDYAMLGTVAGGAIAAIFYLRLRIEELAGKEATRQSSWGGLETEDILYLVPLVTLSNGLSALVVAAAVCAPLYALWTVVEYRKAVRRCLSVASSEAAQ